MIADTTYHAKRFTIRIRRVQTTEPRPNKSRVEGKGFAGATALNIAYRCGTINRTISCSKAGIGVGANAEVYFLCAV
jgi:hypothetical protein